MSTKEQVSQHNRTYYLKNRAAHVARNREYRERNSAHALTYLRQTPCVDCGESDAVVLEFDHVRGEKEADVMVLVWSATSLERIQREIDKCDVVCANCHRRRTYTRCGSRRLSTGSC